MFALVQQSKLVDLQKFAAEHEYEDKRPGCMLQVQADSHWVILTQLHPATETAIG